MGKRVLIIEDEPIIAEMMSIMLEMEGYTVVSLADTARARMKLHQKEIDLVMLDLHLKGENGQSMCTYIKNHKDLKNIPVILVSANNNLEKIKKECRADDHIAKPFDIDGFMGKVKRHSITS